MDTLVVGADDKMPMRFQRKFVVLPNLNLVIAGTGLANLINPWFSFVESLRQVRDIEQLDELAPAALRALAKSCFGSDLTTTTLYHFGYSNEERQYAGYAYRSERNFQSDRLQYALGFKPVVSVAPTEDIRFPDCLVDIAIEQQRQDRVRPATQQVGVGGEIEFVVLSDGAIHVEIVHRFSSYEAELAYIERRAEA